MKGTYQIIGCRDYTFAEYIPITSMAIAIPFVFIAVPEKAI